MMNLLEEAIIYSTVMYQGKVRKIKNSPYILHPLEVAQILSTLTDDLEIIAAGVLHDVVEDTDGTLLEIRKRFGDRVAMLVESETENDYPGEKREDSWQKRKDESLKKLKNSTDVGVKMVWLADKLSNLRSIAGTFGEVGEKVWDNLHQKDPQIQLNYYKTVAEYTEMELGRSGAYKEYIDRINYIWPGTFDSAKTKFRKYREISVEGCPKIGKGAKADVYRYDDELIVKVYNEKNTYKDVEREITLAKTAFVMGLPTAISFGIVSVGKGFGAMFELIDAKTVSEFIAKNPDHAPYYARIMADLARDIHSVRQDSDYNFFPDSKAELQRWVERAFTDEDDDIRSKLKTMVEDIPPTDHLVHGDFHTGNVFLSGGEPLFIDVDRMSVGNPIFDISAVYLFYVGFGKVDPGIIEKFMGFSAQTAGEFYQHFIQDYLQTDDEVIIQSVTQKAELLASVRLIGQIRKKPVLLEPEEDTICRIKDRIRQLLSVTESIVI